MTSVSFKLDYFMDIWTILCCFFGARLRKMSFVWCTNTFFGWTLISAPQHERTVKLLHYELQEIAPFNVKLLAIFSVKHVTVSFLREQSCRWRSLTFISHSALQLSFFPLSGISHSLAFDNLGVGSISNERVQFKPVQKGTLKCTLTMLLVFLLKRSQYFHVSTVFESFALPLQSFFFFFWGGADRFYRTCLTRISPGENFPRGMRDPESSAWH